MEHYIIISGGAVEDAFACRMLKEMQPIHVIAADSGMEFLYRNGLKPEIIIGDFDSVSSRTLAYFRSQTGINWYELNPVKDDTDTEFAIRLAIRLGAERITIIGGTGSRLDHVLGNIELLGIGLENGIPIELLDEHNRIRMTGQNMTIQKEEQFGTYVSLIPYTQTVEHITLKGFKYPLSDACLRGFSSLGVSNEITAETAEISFETGILLVIESRD